VHLPQKTDNLLSVDEILSKNFTADAAVRERFNMEAEIKGAPGFSTNYLLDSVFSGRRITAVNIGISELYRLAYGSYPYNRCIDSIPEKDKKITYCLDIITDKKSELLPTMHKELLARFDVQAEVKPFTKQVLVIRIADPVKFSALKKNVTGIRTYYARHGEIDQQAMTMENFAGFLEDYGSVGNIVLDETGDSGKYDIKFSFEPENPKSMAGILAGMGLKLEKQERKINMLYLCKRN